jgi:phage FluMu protein Com
LNYILKFKDQQEESEKSLEQMTPSEKIESMTGSGTSGVKWLPVDRKEGQQKIFVSSDETMVRIDRERAPHYTRLMRPVKGKSPEYRRLQEDARLNVMKAVFGNSIWKIIKETEKYTYYKEVPEATETTEEKKPEVPGKPEVSKPVIPIRPDPTAFRAPKLPIDTPDLSKATKRMESVTDLFEDEDDLESELLGKKEAPKAEKPKEEAPKAEKPAEGKKKEGLQRVWVELTGGNQLAKVKKENPAARLFTFMQRKGMKETHRVLDPENEADAKIQGFLEMQGPAAKTVNKYTPLILESKEKTASRKSRRDKLISLISK